MYMDFFNLSEEDVYNMSRYSDENLLLEIETREENNDYCFISLFRYTLEQIKGFMENRAIFMEEVQEIEYDEREDYA